MVDKLEKKKVAMMATRMDAMMDYEWRMKKKLVYGI